MNEYTYNLEKRKIVGIVMTNSHSPTKLWFHLIQGQIQKLMTQVFVFTIVSQGRFALLIHTDELPHIGSGNGQTTY